MNIYLNLVFHYFSDNPNDDWTLTIKKMFSIIKGVDRLLELKKVRFNKYRIYFDDGERSFFDSLYPLIKMKDRFPTITLGITTNFIGKSNYSLRGTCPLAKKKSKKNICYGKRLF